MLPSSYYYDPNAISNSPTYTTDKEHTAFTGEEFMTMFLEELKYQDPTAPQDADKILEQTSQLSNLEAIKNQTSTLESLATNLEALQTSNYIHYIGKDISLTNNEPSFTYTGEDVEYLYNLEEYAPNVIIGITDQEGEIVNTFSTTGNEGVNKVSWNGLDSAGNPVENGVYNWALYAVDSNGEQIGMNTKNFTVNSIANKNGVYYMSLDQDGLIQVPASAVGVIR